MAEHAADSPSEIVDTAQQKSREREDALHAKYGEILNTVASMECPDCKRTQRMTVHPGHRVYQLCGHARELPPLPTQRLFSDRRQSGKPRKARR